MEQPHDNDSPFNSVHTIVIWKRNLLRDHVDA